MPWTEVQGARVPFYEANGKVIDYVGWTTVAPSVWPYCQRWISSWAGWYSWIYVPPTPYRTGWIQNNAFGYPWYHPTGGKVPGVATG
jgi:hypothetical protein